MRLGHPWFRLRWRSGANQNGQVIVWVAVMLPLFLSVVGLAIDGGLAFNARRDLQHVADAAARAGAMQIDEQRYRQSGGATVVLDLASARQVATAYVMTQDAQLGATITVEPQRAVVEVSREIPTSFLRVVGITTVRITAAATAEVRYGIEGSVT
jgi:Flp pilus assembly protein TadG